MGFVAYTSILNAGNSPLLLAQDHRETEALLRASGLAWAFLRHGWYSENYTGALAPAIKHGAILGASGEGRISSAPRLDYALADAELLLRGAPGRICELAGDGAFTMTQFAAEVSRQAGKPVVYTNMTSPDYAAALEGMGIPAPFAAILADSSAKSANDELFDASGELGGIIGRPTTPIATSIAQALG